MMTSMTIRSARIGFVTLVAAALTAGICGDALAKATRNS